MGFSTQKDHAAVISWIMMLVELPMCQWEVKNTSCQCHLLTRETAEQEKGAGGRRGVYTHTHTLFTPAQWAMSIGHKRFHLSSSATLFHFAHRSVVSVAAPSSFETINDFPAENSPEWMWLFCPVLCTRACPFRCPIYLLTYHSEVSV